MYKWVALAVLIVSAGACHKAESGDPETRIVTYLQNNVKPGQPVLVTDLYNNVFTTPEERQALQRMYDAFFKIPAFCVDYSMKNGKPPTLKQISDQFQLKVPGEVEVLFRTMEADPRMPRFFERDRSTGEITRIDVDRITADEKFGKPLRNR